MTVISALLAIALLLIVSINRTYSHYPLKELKRRARDGDEIATALVRAVGYGHSMAVVLWFLSFCVAAVLFLFISIQAPAWFALTAIAALIWLGFVWLPAARISAFSERVAAYAAPSLSRVVSYLHPVIDGVIRYIEKQRPLRLHTGLYDRDDLIDLLETQAVVPENRIEKFELDLAMHALTFGDKTIGQTMTPRRVVKMVSVDDQLGPIVMDELHASGHSRFPVYQGSQDTIIGTLYLHDLLHVKSNASVRSLMRPSVYYLHEDQSLYDALQALLVTHHHLFIVVNSFEEFVGVISSEDILETLIGREIVDEFDKYEDLRAVAARAAKQDHKDHVEPVKVATEEAPATTEEETVVE